MAKEHGEALKSNVQVLPGQAIPGAVPPNGKHSVNFRDDPHQAPKPDDRGRGTNDTFA